MKSSLTSSFPSLAWLALLALWMAPLCPAQAETQDGSAAPSAVPISRYQAMIEKSPFAPATAAPPPAVEAPSFAKDYYITGMAQLGSKPFVTISSRDQQKRFSLVEGQSYEGMTLTNVEWSPGVGRSKATLQKGSEFGVISFDEAAMQVAPVPVQTPAVAQNQPPERRGRGGGNFGYGDRRRRRPDGGGEGWQERRRAWMEANRAQAGQGQSGQPQGQQGQPNGAQWRRRPAPIQ